MTSGPSPAAIPLVSEDDEALRRLAAGGIPPSNLYRVLANQPAMLEAWTAFAWKLRRECVTPRDLRELLILRAAQLTGARYIWQDHVPMALEAGVRRDRIDELHEWRRAADQFSGRERIALAFAEQVIVDGEPQEDVLLELAEAFVIPERIELAMTIGFYAMVPRVLAALRVPLAPVDGPGAGPAVPFRPAPHG
ncbi:MAG TPA: carboxymuconolactone decarboxylase family protein [Solirubrobacteraceae bacterium]|nr:carboxymuconolactone decarboxylase family protein [Solirubrobacteraceae bacterium]